MSWLARRAGNDFSRRQLLEPIRERRGSNKNPSPPSESPRSGKLARRYLQRQQLLDLGAAALAYLTELTHRQPQIWIHDVERLQEQLQTHTSKPFVTDRLCVEGKHQFGRGAQYAINSAWEECVPMRMRMNSSRSRFPAIASISSSVS